MLIQHIIKNQIHQWTFICQICGKKKQRGGPNQKVCSACKSQSRRIYSQSLYKRNFGDICICTKCQGDYVFEHSTQTLCKSCRRQVLSKTAVIKCRVCREHFKRRTQRQVFCSSCRRRGDLKAKRDDYFKNKDNPEFKKKSLQRAKIWQNRRYRENAGFNLNKKIRSAIYRTLGKQKAGRKWESLVGYTIEELMRHLERQFLPGMSWDNRHLWHIDHRQPLASFSFTTAEDPEFRAAWALTNLQPLWAKDNLEKRAQRLHLL